MDLFFRTAGRYARRATIAAGLLGVLFAAGWQRLYADEATEEAAGAAAAEARLDAAVRFLADDAREGRGIGTGGLDAAAEYLADQFAALGLATDAYDGRPFQVFQMSTGTELGEPNRAAFVGPSDDDGEPIEITLEIEEDFTPLAIGGSGVLDAPVVFVGYGITGPDEGYDDYEGLDVEGKAVIVMRHEPQQDNPHSAFNGTDNSRLATFVRKLSNAYEHGASAVIFVTDEFELKKQADRRVRFWQQALNELAETRAEFDALEEPTLTEMQQYVDRVATQTAEITDQNRKLGESLDPLLRFTGAGSGSDSPRIPVMHCTRAAIDKALRKALDTDLATLELEIDKGPTPHSRELEGWRLQGEVTVDRTEADVKNVVAVLEGEGPHADETIVVGAHYDHLGMGGPGSFVPTANEVHNGADDNGSGAAALVEVARRLAQREEKLPRRVVFIAFTGEERGLIGSARYCKDPLVPLDKTVAMLNMDMVGRLDDNKLIIQGHDTAVELEPIIDQLNERFGFDLTKKPGGFGPSDHASFYTHDVPVLHFFTGLHEDYHRPSDDADRINVPGMRRIAEMVADTAVAIATADEPLTFQQGDAPAMAGGGDSDRPYFGSIPDFAQAEEGYAISGVAKNSPAAEGGLEGGDVIIRFGDSKIGSLEDFDSALRKYKAGDKVPVVVRRDGEEKQLEVKLAPPR